MKGNTVRWPLRVESDVTYTPLPPSVHECYKEVTLTADIMFVNAILFFVSLSRKIKFGTIEALDRQTGARLFKAFQSMAQVNHHGGFRIRHCMMGDLLGVQVLIDTASRYEHVG